MVVSSSSVYLIIIPLFVHSFKSVGNNSFPIIPLIIVVFPAFDAPIKGINIASYIPKSIITFFISS